MRSFKPTTSIGNDHWKFRILVLLPDDILESFGSLLVAVRDLLAPPLQTMCNNLTRLPKKTGGDRTVAVASSFYRILMAVDHDRILLYSQSNTYFRDSARRGQSALHSAESRAFEAELAVLNG